MAGKVCPHWVGYLLASPLRRLFHNPRKILGPYVEPGMTVLDIGCAMGFFSLPLARMIGKRGKVVCVDAQENMLVSLQKRARKAGLADRIIPHLCPRDSLFLDAFEGKRSISPWPLRSSMKSPTLPSSSPKFGEP